MSGGDGFARYGSLRVTHVGQDFLILDWAYQTDPGNPELVVGGGVRTARPSRGHRAEVVRPCAGRCVCGQFRLMPTDTLLLDGHSLTIADVVRAARNPACRVGVRPAALAALDASRARVERALASGQTIYGINTGFGKLANVRIAPADLDRLQVNLIRSHAAGVGAPLPAGNRPGADAAPGQRAAPAHQRRPPRAGRGAPRRC